MTAEVVDTNVLVLATASVEGWTRPRVPTDDVAVLRKVHQWLQCFGDDAERKLTLDGNPQTIHAEYRRNLPRGDLFGRRIVQKKFDQGALKWVALSYWLNGTEPVAHLPREVEEFVHDLGDRSMVAAANQAGAPIVNAADSDWTEPKVVRCLGQLGIEVVQLLTNEERAACRERE